MQAAAYARVVKGSAIGVSGGAGNFPLDHETAMAAGALSVAVTFTARPRFRILFARVYDTCMAIPAFVDAHPSKQPDAEPC